jgi:hypothetical protein
MRMRLIMRLRMHWICRVIVHAGGRYRTTKVSVLAVGCTEHSPV